MRAEATAPRAFVGRSGAADARPAVRRTRRRLAVALGLTALLAGGYQLWFRDSSFVEVESATVVGLTTDDAPQIEVALVEAARGMSTLHVRQDALERAVSPYPEVSAVRAAPDFPHAMRITVVEQAPVAVLAGPSGDELPVAADGTLLEGVDASGLPTVPLPVPAAGEVVRDRESLRLVAVAAAAPEELAAQVEEIDTRARGELGARLTSGPELVFGDDTRLEAKWAAAATALADPATESADYIDLRLPERPAAG